MPGSDAGDLPLLAPSTRLLSPMATECLPKDATMRDVRININSLTVNIPEGAKPEDIQRVVAEVVGKVIEAINEGNLAPASSGTPTDTKASGTT